MTSKPSSESRRQIRANPERAARVEANRKELLGLCAWCESALEPQHWIALWFSEREIHCCSEEHLTLWLDAHRAMRGL